jgi:hypothetical protein
LTNAYKEYKDKEQDLSYKEYLMLLGDVEKLLRDGLEIDEENRSTFKSRIKHLQRMQFPPGTNTGKGKKFDYGWPQIIQYIVVFDLLDQGMSPEIATSLVVESESKIERGAITFARMLSSSDSAHEMVSNMKSLEGQGMFLRCVANGLGSLKRNDSNNSHFVEVLVDSIFKTDGKISPHFFVGRNAIFLNFAPRILHAINFVGVKLETGLDEALCSYIAWAESRDEDNAETS